MASVNCGKKEGGTYLLRSEVVRFLRGADYGQIFECLAEWHGGRGEKLWP